MQPLDDPDPPELPELPPELYDAILAQTDDRTRIEATLVSRAFWGLNREWLRKRRDKRARTAWVAWRSLVAEEKEERETRSLPGDTPLVQCALRGLFVSLPDLRGLCAPFTTNVGISVPVFWAPAEFSRGRWGIYRFFDVTTQIRVVATNLTRLSVVAWGHSPRQDPFRDEPEICLRLHTAYFTERPERRATITIPFPVVLAALPFVKVGIEANKQADLVSVRHNGFFLDDRARVQLMAQPFELKGDGFRVLYSQGTVQRLEP